MLADELSAGLAAFFARAKRAEWCGDFQLVVFVLGLGDDAVFDFLRSGNRPPAAFRLFVPIEFAKNFHAALLVDLQPRRIGERGGFYSAGLEAILVRISRINRNRFPLDLAFSFLERGRRDFYCPLQRLDFLERLAVECFRGFAHKFVVLLLTDTAYRRGHFNESLP